MSRLGVVRLRMRLDVVRWIGAVQWPCDLIIAGASLDGGR